MISDDEIKSNIELKLLREMAGYVGELMEEAKRQEGNKEMFLDQDVLEDLYDTYAEYVDFYKSDEQSH